MITKAAKKRKPENFKLELKINLEKFKANIYL